MQESAHPILRAFPRRVHAAAGQLAAIVARDATARVEPTEVVVERERLEIPGRLYSQPLDDRLIESLPETHQLLARCWFTRHHDGFVRQRSLAGIPSLGSELVLPFVLLLTGEYLIEILDDIWSRRDELDRGAMLQFASSNRPLIARTSQRVRSYWDRYHRLAHWDYTAYVGSRIMGLFSAESG